MVVGLILINRRNIFLKRELCKGDKETMASLQEIADRLLRCSEVCIVYHIRPDGDCIGSAYALAIALQAAGIRTAVTGRDPVPKQYRYLTDAYVPDTLTDPVYLSLDTSSAYRTGTFENQHFTFCIDHHNGNSVSADYKYVEPDCGACSEIIYKLLLAMQCPVTKQIADLLYTALVTDTLCFRTSDADAQTFRTAAALAECGADIEKIGKQHMLYKSKGRMQIEDALRRSFHSTCGDRLLTGIILRADLAAADVEDSELEGINAYVEQIEEMQIGVTLRELPDGRTRCSVHTKDAISAHAICQRFGGGGHFHAAGCELDTPPEQSRAIVEAVCREYLGESGGSI